MYPEGVLGYFGVHEVAVTYSLVDRVRLVSRLAVRFNLFLLDYLSLRDKTFVSSYNISVTLIVRTLLSETLIECGLLV